MALLFTDSMSTYDSNTVQFKYDYISGEATVFPSGGGVNGTSYFQIRFGAIERIANGTTGLSAYTVGIRFQNASSAVQTTEIYFGNQHEDNEVVTIVSIVVQLDRTIGMFTNGIPVCNSGTLGAVVLPNNLGWQYLEFQFGLTARTRTGSSDPTDQTIWCSGEIRLNSQLVSAPIGGFVDSGITVSTVLLGDAIVNSHEFLGDNQIADIYIKENDDDDLIGNERYYGDCKIVSVFPTSDGSDTNWSGSFNAIDTNPPPGSGIVPGTDDPSFSNFYFGHISPSFSGQIASVMLWGCATGDGESFFHGYIGNPPNRFEGGGMGQPQFVDYYFGTHFTKNFDPSVDAQWTPSNFNAEAFGYYT